MTGKKMAVFDNHDVALGLMPSLSSLIGTSISKPVAEKVINLVLDEIINKANEAHIRHSSYLILREYGKFTVRKTVTREHNIHRRLKFTASDKVQRKLNEV